MKNAFPLKGDETAKPPANFPIYMILRVVTGIQLQDASRNADLPQTE
jgi:hypothetical protein